MNTRAWIALVSSLLATCAWGADAPAQSDLGARVDRYVQAFLEDGHLSGSLLIAREGTVVLERSWGAASYELGVANGPETRFNIASLTKPTTVVILSRLVEQGTLKLDDPIAKWIPDFPRADKITVGLLAGHRSGVPHRVTTDAEEAVPRSPAEIVEFARRKGLEFEPGARESYSSAGYTVLVRVMELASGKRYPELLASYVLEPAGLHATAHADSVAILPHRAASYVPTLDGIENAPLKDLSFLAGAGSLWSTPRDLHRLVLALRAGKLGAGALANYSGALDWNGLANGFAGFVHLDPESGIEVIFLGNLQTGAVDRLRADLPRLAAGEVVDDPEPLHLRPVAVDAATLRSYEGVYRVFPGLDVTLRERDGRLYSNEWLMVPTSPTSFFSPRDYGRVDVVRAEDGSVERLDWTQRGKVYPCPRVGDAPADGDR